MKYLAVILTCFLTGCASVSNQKVDLIQVNESISNSSDYRYILVHSKTKLFRDGVHAIPFWPSPHEDNDWIFLKANSGKQCVPDITYSNYENKFEYPWSSEIKGCIELTDTFYLIDIYFPKYENGKKVKDKWVPYEFNGQYRVE
tara:strand:+ start:876 stop:1307 length:432 start_codon:yes stop_codon:yes gene_type:complete